jgi:RNA polymerase sigma factor (sigma-70 family)
MDDHLPISDLEPNVLDQLGAEALLTLIQQMPEGYRTVFNLFAIEGHGHKEIADMLGISENTSKTQFLKAKSWLKKRISEPSEDESIEEHEGFTKG